jgi:small-conductance mechanosensitive channel/CRP-like cAMP-binding protein
MRMIAGLILGLASLALRSASTSRRVRAKLLTSCLLFATSTVAAALLAYAPLTPAVVEQIHTINPLLLTFGVINALVVLAINSWRQDRVSERFPNIVQDTIVIGIFALAAILFMQDKILATTAVGAVVLGFALQDTLGNLFAGLAIQIEKPFRVGHWVTIAGIDGAVAEVTWRATKLRTKAGNFLIVPNSVVAKETITNYSEPTRETRLEVEVGVSYDAPPNQVKAVIREALRGEPSIVSDREPDILLTDFAASSITYRIRVWTTDFSADMVVRDRVRTLVYYAFRRHGVNIPYPVQVQLSELPTSIDSTSIVGPDALDAVAIFAPLNADQRGRLLHGARALVYSAGEPIVREGAHGSSMFLLLRGDAIVTLARTSGEVARLRDGDFFGEMSLLTGEPRTATVTAATDCHVLEIGVDAFRRVALADPAIIELVTTAVTARQTELDAHRATKSAAPDRPEAPQNFLTRVRDFLKI